MVNVSHVQAFWSLLHKHLWALLHKHLWLFYTSIMVATLRMTETTVDVKWLYAVVNYY